MSIALSSSHIVSINSTTHQRRLLGSHGYFLYLSLILIVIVDQSKSASFYGLSYIKLPLQDTKNSTDLEFRFKTHQLNAFLFLAAGSSDYCLVFLENGQLAVKINFGFGETYLASDGLQLNDLSWHKVKLKLAKSHLSLTIDEKYSYLQRIKGESLEFHIKYGIFLGGQDNFKSLYLGNLRPLRGCLDQVYFNQKDVLEASNKHGIMHNVAPVCDEQFTVGPNSTISFTDNDSFVIFPGLSQPSSKNLTKLSIHFELKTISRTAIIVFSPSSNPYKRQYIAVELIEGKVRFSIKDGTADHTVQSFVTVNDGQWHQVEIRTNDNHLQVSVDGRVESKHINGKRSFFFQQYSSEVLLGGLSTSKQSVALNYGLQSVLMEQNVSLKGCLRNVHINSKFVSLFDALATSQIKTGKCKWHFLCADHEKSPCIEGSQCVQHHINKVRCICNSDNCVRPHFKHKTVVVKSEIAFKCNRHLKHIKVLEGSSTFIGKDVLDDLFTQSNGANILVEVVQMPKYGLLEALSGRSNLASNVQSLDWFDLEVINLQYKHDGSEHYNDTIILRLVKATNDEIEPIKNGQTCDQTLALLIEIESSNDAPNKNNVIKMKMAKNSKKVVSYNLLKPYYREQKFKPKKEDILQFKVHEMLNAGLSYFEKINKPHVPVFEFFENDIKSQSIRFVHVANGSTISSPIEVTLHVYANQPDKVDRELRLSIDTYEIELVQMANTGLFMAHNTMTMISSANLSYSIGNETDQSQLIKYEIVSGPKYGIVQKLRSSANQWANATQFSQRQIDRAKVRYLHMEDRPKQDKVQLKVSFNKQMFRPVSVVITFVDNLMIVSLGSNRYNLSNQDRDLLIDNTKLSYFTAPIRTSPADILLTLLSVPRFGELYLTQINGKRMKLDISSSFSQKDIDEGKLSFERNSSQKFHTKEDSFDFEVAAVGSNATQIATFSFYVGQSSENYVLVNNKISVLEGEKVTIDKNYLFFIAEDGEIWFNITKQPKHGSIQILSADHQETNIVSPTLFSQQTIQEKRVVYVHDNSENDIDTFEFVVVNSTSQIIATGKFFIEVAMINDNSPIRIIDKPFNVIRNNEKFLRGTDIKYVDPDINTSASDIIYTKNYIPNGNLFYINDTVADKFSQDEIDRGLIKYKHNGSDLGKAMLWVTDGQNYLSGVLEIRASEPYIKLVNNTGITLKYGDNVIITNAHLSIDTNLDLSNKSNVIFKISTEPKLGQLLVNEKSVKQFTLKELEDEMVEFESTAFEDELPLSNNDTFTFRIFINANVAQANRLVDTYEFIIRIYPQSYFTITLINQCNLTVLEEKTITLDSSCLLAEHSELKPEQIVYRITEKPKYGLIKNLKLDNLADMAKQSGQRLTFSQKEINEGNIVYQNIRLDSDLYVQYWDSFVFDVGNEIVSLHKRTLFIEVIPKLIIILTTNVSVEEGHAAILTEENLLISHPHYFKLVDEFIVVEEPKYGNIFSNTSDGVQLSAKSFTLDQLKEGKILYKQDSSEVDRDWFTIVARSNLLNKESLPATIHITIQSVNDEAPKIVNNSEAYVWKDSSVQITNWHLAAEDADTSEQEIMYTTYLVTNGYLINIESNTTIDSFSQEDINSGRIYFVHVGTGDASFTFHVSDGKNSGITSVFNVKERQRKMSVAVNEKLFVIPGMIQSITRRHLRVQANDHENSINREFVFQVVKAPSFGKIVLEGFKDEDKKVSQFTQKQIDQNLVLYEQIVLISEPVITDRIVFSIQSEGMPSLDNVHFLVEIAVEGLKTAIDTNMNELVQIVPLTVEEGKFGHIGPGEINLTRLMLETQSTDKLCFKIIHAPVHGLVLKSGVKVLDDACIASSALSNKSLVYMHDDSNTFNDSIQLNLMLANGVSISLLNFTVPIQILPVNDEFPVVINRNPLLKAIFGTKTLLSNQILNCRDNDALASGVIYQIRKDNNVSRESYFFVQPRDVAVYEFTQDDIDSHRVFFSHKGQEMQITYWFRVKDHPSVQCSDDISAYFYQPIETTDNAHCTPYYPLKVTVSQLSLQLLNHSTIQLAQATFQVPITRSNLATVSKSASSNFIIYKITKGPFHGYISVENEMSQNEFSQKQIDAQLVQYVQTNMSSEDFFLVDIIQYENLYNEKPIYDVNVKITTKPMIKALKPFLVANPGQLSLLSTDYLDASELAFKSKSNPIFKILTQPRHGFFKLLNFGENVIHQSAETPKQSQFSQEDIITNRIAYVANANIDLNYPNEILIDVIDYELSATNVQDAHGILVVNIFNNRSYVDLETLVSQDNYMHTIDVKLSKQVLFIIFAITVSLVFVVCLVVIIRTCSCTNLRHSCPQHNPIKSLSPNENLNKSDRQYSSTSLRQTECSSHTSSNSALACVQQANHHQMIYELPQISPMNANKAHSIKRTLFEESIDCSSDLMSKMRPIGPLSDKSEDISPLPPPSLYFINDASFDDQPMWNKAVQRYEDNEILSKYQKEQVNRSSGDGASHSNPSPHSSSNVKINYKAKPFDQMTHLENYLSKSDHFAREEAFCTLNKMHTLKSPHTQMRNQYWI